MAIISPQETQKSYDVLIVGSGAGGGQIAYLLAMLGAKVLVLEAGRTFDPVRETAMFHTPNMAPLRAEKTPDKQYGFYDSSVDSGWEIPGKPYWLSGQHRHTRMEWSASRGFSKTGTVSTEIKITKAIQLTIFPWSGLLK